MKEDRSADLRVYVVVVSGRDGGLRMSGKETASRVLLGEEYREGVDVSRTLPREKLKTDSGGT